MTNSQAFPARISTLDGWRGVAILLVLTEHAALYTRYTDRNWASLGSFGVDIFFVLSGYLITSRLLDERSQSGSFSLKNFYIRRAFRILPAVLVYLAVLCFVAPFISRPDLRPSDIAGSLFFFRNYQFSAHARGPYTQHFWSLSVEEHFYLFWPAVLLWLGNRRSLWFAAVAAVSSATWRFWLGTHPLLRAGHWISSPTFGFSTLRTDARLDGLLIGSGLALLLNLPRVHQFVFRNFPKETPLLAGCLLYINLFRTRSLPAFSSYVLLALILASTLIVKEGLAYKWLNFRPLVWIGSISYSLYLWNELFLLRPSGSPALGRFSELPLNLICAFCAASASYYLVERPLKAYGNRCLRQRDTLPAEVTVNP